MKIIVFVVTLLTVHLVHAEAPHKSSDSELTAKPTMRPVDRDWQYFKAVPCEEVDKLVFHSRSEEIYVAKRKSQCKKQLMNQYKAFLPEPTM